MIFALSYNSGTSAIVFMFLVVIPLLLVLSFVWPLFAIIFAFSLFRYHSATFTFKLLLTTLAFSYFSAFSF